MAYLGLEEVNFLLGGLGSVDGNDHNLSGSHTRGKDETLVITVDHAHDTNGTGGVAPAVLPHILAN